MSVIDTLITDRTAEDVRRAGELNGKYPDWTEAEKTEWESGMKGAYNAADLNRVESAVSYLANNMNALPEDLKTLARGLDVAWDRAFEVSYSNVDVSTKEDWTGEDIPQAADMTRYLENVRDIVAAFPGLDAELPDTMDRLTYMGANEIENGLLTAYRMFTQEKERLTAMIENAAQSWYYSGDIFTGELIT